MINESYNHLIGKTIEEAKKLTGLQIRASSIDGKSMVGTADVRMNRLNVAVKDGKISAIHGRG
jgi:hypothetical protein